MIDHIDGKITGELARYVEIHIEKHPEAKLEYEELKKVMHLISASEDFEVPESGKELFMQEAKRELRITSYNVCYTKLLRTKEYISIFFGGDVSTSRHTRG